ncbi:DUF427 domain-containing protein [Kineococcus gynurae]|uniref:DUF427 domain-containing protein n=1 Tax=Kineococcus gynurae TaxID=452979 RepID=A0ABV5LQR6_9ACTN
MRPVHREPCGPGQESVWDYPRPPRVEVARRRVRVADRDGTLLGEAPAGSGRAWRVLETSHPPTYYLARSVVDPRRVRANDDRSWCEFKGEAVYHDVLDAQGRVLLPSAAWTYPLPHADYAPLAGAFAFYPGRLVCHLDDELVRPQAGGFYGGWITDDVVGPFKGEHGTHGW